MIYIHLDLLERISIMRRKSIKRRDKNLHKLKEEFFNNNFKMNLF